jgi:hypothetical protein
VQGKRYLKIADAASKAGITIQCDEKRPSCSNCVRRRIDCDFLQVKPTQLGGSPAAALNMMDLELLHCYTTTTYLTLSENPVRLGSTIKPLRFLFSP